MNWSVSASIQKKDDGSIELDRKQNGTKAVGDVVALQRVNELYEQLKDSDNLSDEAKRVMADSTKLNEELSEEITEMVVEKEDTHE